MKDDVMVRRMLEEQSHRNLRCNKRVSVDRRSL